MSWFQSFEGENSDMEKAIRAPLGAASPLWWAFAGVATAGVAYWWLTRWTKPMNLEAAAPAAPAALPPEAPPALEEAAATYELAPAAIEDVVDTPPTKSDNEPELTPEIEALADDLTQLVGIGPKLAAALADRGVTRFTQIAAWSDDDLAQVDRDLNLRGRAQRDQWVAQARKLADGPKSTLQ